MTGVIVAAGRGIRMGPFTEERPKCMLDIKGRTLLSHSIEALRGAGCAGVTVVTGHLADRIEAAGCALVHNSEYARNNILHSLMYARTRFCDDVVVSYSDIFVEPWVHQCLVGAAGDIVLAVDRDWTGYYAGRVAHPIDEAEKVFVAPDTDGSTGMVKAVGKTLDMSRAAPDVCGEFLGLWKMTRAGARLFRERFETLDRELSPEAPFGEAPRWRQAYVTDLLMDLVRGGVEIRCILVERGWAEFDVTADYQRLASTIRQQRLVSLESDT